MPVDPVQRERRLGAIKTLLERHRISRQGELLERLRARGFMVTQSIVSRDLRDLEVVKDNGNYRLPDAGAAPPAAGPTGAALIKGMTTAGPNLCVVHTAIGGASRVGLEVDRAAWPEVVGTVAGDDTLFVATPGRREQRRVMQKIQALIKGEANDA